MLKHSNLTTPLPFTSAACKRQSWAAVVGVAQDTVNEQQEHMETRGGAQPTGSGCTCWNRKCQQLVIQCTVIPANSCGMKSWMRVSSIMNRRFNKISKPIALSMDFFSFWANSLPPFIHKGLYFRFCRWLNALFIFFPSRRKAFFMPSLQQSICGQIQLAGPSADPFRCEEIPVQELLQDFFSNVSPAQTWGIWLLCSTLSWPVLPAFLHSPQAFYLQLANSLGRCKKLHICVRLLNRDIGWYEGNENIYKPRKKQMPKGQGIFFFFLLRKHRTVTIYIPAKNKMTQRNIALLKIIPYQECLPDAKYHRCLQSIPNQVSQCLLGQAD